MILDGVPFYKKAESFFLFMPPSSTLLLFSVLPPLPMPAALTATRPFLPGLALFFPVVDCLLNLYAEFNFCTTPF